MSTSLVFASMLSYLMKPISSCICYFAFCSHIFFLYVIYTLLVFVTCCQTFFHSNRFFSYFFFCLWLPLSSIVSVLPSFFYIEFCFLKQCNNNSNKFTFLVVFFSGGIYGILVIVFYVLWLFRRKSEKNLRLYRGHETGKEINKQKMQPIFVS